MKWIVDLESQGARLNAFLKQKLQVSKREIAWAIEHNRCRINGHVERFQSTRLQVGDHVECFLETHSYDGGVIFEDEALIIYNKPPGISSPDLATQLNLLLVHRLDRDTSGLIIFAKNVKAQNALEDLFRKRLIEKTYLAVVIGRPKERAGRIDASMAKIGAREGAVRWGVSEKGVHAITEWSVESVGKEFSLLKCKPLTGRTHQIRVHLSWMGYPILGDHDYGSKKAHPVFQPLRPLLHAESLIFTHPFTCERIAQRTSAPSDFLIL